MNTTIDTPSPDRRASGQGTPAYARVPASYYDIFVGVFLALLILSGVTAGREVFLSRDFVRTREAVIATSEELRERELMKAATMAAELRAVLVGAGTDEATARMTADLGVAVFLEATRRWQAGDDAPFGELVDQAAQLLRRTAGGLAPSPT